MNTPVATDERSYDNETMADLIRMRACDVIQPDVTNDASIQAPQHAAEMEKARYMTFGPARPQRGRLDGRGAAPPCRHRESRGARTHGPARPVGDEIVKHDFEVENGTSKFGTNRGRASSSTSRPPASTPASRRTATPSPTSGALERP